MPAGVSWGQYLKFMSCAMLAMMAGSQAVHMYYKPLQDLDVYIEKEMKQMQHLGELEIRSADASGIKNSTNTKLQHRENVSNIK